MATFWTTYGLGYCFGYGLSMVQGCSVHVLIICWRCFTCVLDNVLNMIGEYVGDALSMCSVCFGDVMFRIYFGVVWRYFEDVSGMFRGCFADVWGCIGNVLGHDLEIFW